MIFTVMSHAIKISRQNSKRTVHYGRHTILSFTLNFKIITFYKDKKIFYKKTSYDTANVFAVIRDKYVVPFRL